MTTIQLSKVDEAITLVKELGDMPPNILTPQKLLSYYTYKHEHKSHLPGLSAIAGNSPYGIGRIFGNKDIAVIGKGITFDTGGISIKPSNNMSTMKYDMLGAATALALSSTVNNPPDIFGCVAENSFSGNSYRPGDVITFTDKKKTRVEVTNTDAEGRLALADGINAALEFSPRKLIITIATLTGAARVLTPSTVVVGNNADLLELFLTSAIDQQESVIVLPMLPEHIKAIRAKNKKVADIVNSCDHPAGATTAAAFIHHFIGNTPWIHLDIAGSGTDKKGPTGVMVKTLTHFLNNIQV